MLDRGTKLNPMMSGMSSVPSSFNPNRLATCATDALGGVVEVASGQKLDVLSGTPFQATRHEGHRLLRPQEKVARFAVNYTTRKGGLSKKDAPKTSQYLENPAFLSGGGAFAPLRTITCASC